MPGYRGGGGMRQGQRMMQQMQQPQQQQPAPGQQPVGGVPIGPQADPVQLLLAQLRRQPARQTREIGPFLRYVMQHGLTPTMGDRRR